MKSREALEAKLAEVESDFDNFIKEEYGKQKKKKKDLYTLGLFNGKLATLKWALNIDDQVI